jgi:DNA-binding response OmpR family regulator
VTYAHEFASAFASDAARETLIGSGASSHVGMNDTPLIESSSLFPSMLNPSADDMPGPGRMPLPFDLPRERTNDSNARYAIDRPRESPRAPDEVTGGIRARDDVSIPLRAEGGDAAVLIGDPSPRRMSWLVTLSAWGFEPIAIDSPDALSHDPSLRIPLLLLPSVPERMVIDILMARSRRPGAPICVAGFSRDPMLGAEALRAGADDYWHSETSALEQRDRLEALVRRFRYLDDIVAEPSRAAVAVPRATSRQTQAREVERQSPPNDVIGRPYRTASGTSVRAKVPKGIAAIRARLGLDGDHVPMNPRTMDVLNVFIANPGRVLSHRELHRLAWESEPSVGGYARISSAVHRIRQVLEPEPEMPQVLVTIRGRGYCYRPLGE